MIQHLCKTCGGVLLLADDGRWQCPYCKNIYEEEKVKSDTEELKKLLDDIKIEQVSNLRRNLYDAVNAEYTDSEEICRICGEIKSLLPDDFAAGFYYIANHDTPKQICEAIRKTDCLENASLVESIVRHITKSMRSEYALPLQNLVERAYKDIDLQKYEELSTIISEEIQKVNAGTYVTSYPRDIFVAYSSKDMAEVERLVEYLENNYLDCFVAARNLRHGRGAIQNYEKALHEAIDNCRSVVFVSSQNSRTMECDALKVELKYIRNYDILNAPPEYKQNYLKMPSKYKKKRIEYRIDNKKSQPYAEKVVNEFFGGLEYAYSPEEVLDRFYKFDEDDIEEQAEEKAPPTVIYDPTVKEPAPNPAYTEPAPKPIYNPIIQTPAGQSNTDSLLRRIEIFLSDGDFEKAEEYCEKVLDIEPENPQAYLYKVMVERKVKRESELVKLPSPFNSSPSFAKAYKFGDDAFKNKLENYISTINTRIEEEKQSAKYNEAKKLLKDAHSSVEYKAAASAFAALGNYRDSEKLKKDCEANSIKSAEREKENALNEAFNKALAQKQAANTPAKLRAAGNAFKKLSGYLNADAMVDICFKEADELEKKTKYDSAKAVMQMHATVSQLNDSASAFASLGDYLDSEALSKECEELAKKRAYDDAKFSLSRSRSSKPLLEAAKEFDKLGGFLDSHSLASECRTKAAKYAEEEKERERQKRELAERQRREKEAANEAARKERERRAAKERAKEKRKKRFSLFVKLVAVALVLLGIVMLFRSCFVVNLKFSLLDDGTYEVRGSGGIGFGGGDIVIPSTYNGKPVTAIAYGAFRDRCFLKSVVIPQGIKIIDDSAFSNCDYNLETVVIPEGVISIGERAFHMCGALKNVTLPRSLKSIGPDAFTECRSLNEINFMGTESEWKNISKGSNWDDGKDLKINYLGKEETPALPTADLLSYNGHYYMVINEYMTWEEADEYCKKIGGYLVVITDEDEQEYISALLADDEKAGRNNYFIGATDKNKEDQWEWTNGEAFEYSNWLEGEPDNWNGISHYAVIHGPNVAIQDSEFKWGDFSNEGYISNDYGNWDSPSDFGFIIEFDSLPSGIR